MDHHPVLQAATAPADPQAAVYDCVIIGGGPAGLTAAMVLGRCLRRVALVNAGQQSNLISGAVHGLFTRDCTDPAELYAIARRQLARYPTLEQFTDLALSIATGPPFSVALRSGAELRGELLLLAQGMNYEHPPVPGLDALWGRKAWHCPYCDGFEAMDVRLLAIGDEPWQAGMRLLLARWTDQITWVNADCISHVAEVKDEVVAEIAGQQLAFDQVIAQTRVTARDGIADRLGCRRNPKGQVEIGDAGETCVPGIYAVGDQSEEAGQVNIAVAVGHKAGIAINEELLRRRHQESTQRAG